MPSYVPTAHCPIDTNIVDVERLDVLQQFVTNRLGNLAERIAPNRAVVIDENGFFAVAEHRFKFLFVVLGGVRLE